MRTCFLLPMMLLVSFCVEAQHNYFKINVGYGFPFQKNENMETFSLRYSQGSNQVIEEIKTISARLGRGIETGLSFGREFNDHVAIQLDAYYMIGRASKSVSELIYYSDRDSLVNTYTGKNYGLSPLLIFSNKFWGDVEWEHYKAYVAVGPSFNLPSYTHMHRSKFWNGDEGELVREFKPNLTFGLRTVVGAEVKLNDRMLFDVNIAFNNINYSPVESELTAYTWNRIDSLSTLNTNEKKTEYKAAYNNRYELDSNGDIVMVENINEASVRSKYYVSFGSIRLGIAIKYLF